MPEESTVIPMTEKGTKTDSVKADSRLAKLVKLKDFSVTRGMPADKVAITEINALEAKHQVSNFPWEKEDLDTLDLITRALSELTYPITIDNVENVYDTSGQAFSYRWVNRFLGIGIFLAVFSGILMALIKKNPMIMGADLSELWKVAASISLGAVGAVIYVMLPNGRINIVAGLDRETITTNGARIGIGGLLGYVIYLIKPQIFDTSTEPLSLLLPLVGGYSISLVVGILSKAVNAVELTLGLDDKRLNTLRK